MPQPKHPGGKMQKFSYNAQEIRFFEAGDDVYFVTADVNRAFGFSGENTLADRISQRLEDLAKHISDMDSTEQLQKNTLVLQTGDLVRAIIRSSKSDPHIHNIKDALIEMAASAFKKSFTQPPERLALPAATDHDRVEKLATASRNHNPDKPPQNLELMDGWNTITETLTELGEDPKEEASLINDARFRFWINRQIADIYRAQKGEEPPIARRKKGKGYVYPPLFHGLVRLYRSNWLIDNS
jgi:hypothetical protein